MDFLEKSTYVESIEEDVRFMLWDTAGQEEFDTITRSYYRGGGACILAFSTIDRASFEAIPKWKKKVEEECGKIAMAIIQNKVDMIDEAAMSPAEAESLARTHNLKFFRTCVKENLNVKRVFQYLAEQHSRMEAAGTLGRPVDEVPGPQRKLPDLSDAPAPKKKGGKAAKKQKDGEDMIISLAPSKQRTGGKKKISAKMKNCPIA